MKSKYVFYKKKVIKEMKSRFWVELKRQSRLVFNKKDKI